MILVMFRSTEVSPKCHHFQFLDTVSTLFPLSLLFNPFSLQKKLQVWLLCSLHQRLLWHKAAVKGTRVMMIIWEEPKQQPRGVRPQQLQTWGCWKAGARHFLAAESPSGEWTIIRKSCSWMVYPVPASIPARGDWKCSTKPVWSPSYMGLRIWPTTSTSIID